MKLKIFSLNCWLLPSPFSINNKIRLSSIISLIRKYSPDIIALQEVWLNGYAKRIENNLKDYYFIKQNSGFYNKSGLITGISKKVSDFNNIPFPFTEKHSLLEKTAQKGYQVLKLTDNLFFVNTHFYCPTNKTEESITNSQFNLIQNFMPSKYLIVVGDFNLNEDRIDELNNRFNYDRSFGFTVSDTNNLTKVLFNKFGKSNQKIDYHFFSKKGNITFVTECLKNPIVSDHFALVSDVSVK